MSNPIKVLLVDDDDTYRKVLCRELDDLGYTVKGASNGNEALSILSEEDYDVVLLDIKMPGLNGIDALKMIKESSPLVEVVMLTGHGTLDNAIASMKSGAFDFITKPCKLNEIEAVLQKAAEKKSLACENRLLKLELTAKEHGEEFVGESPKFKEVITLANKVAATDSTVLIQGESGTGKEVIARFIHKKSGRSDKPFVVIDCGSLQDALLESELFGHEKGAYTGAISLKYGLLEVANSGSLFMDEVGELSPAIQAKLLRVMETGSFRRVGGTKSINADIRIIAATNRDLRLMREQGAFREDLFYRFNVFSITAPPLRERKEDVPLLAAHLLKNMRGRAKGQMSISDHAMEMLMNYYWPGNIRELQNVIERAAILAEDNLITPKDLPSNLAEEFTLSDPTDSQKAATLDEIEKRYITFIMRKFSGHRSNAAKALGISERNLYRLIKNYGLSD